MPKGGRAYKQNKNDATMATSVARIKAMATMGLALGVIPVIKLGLTEEELHYVRITEPQTRLF